MRAEKVLNVSDRDGNEDDELERTEEHAEARRAENVRRYERAAERGTKRRKRRRRRQDRADRYAEVVRRMDRLPLDTALQALLVLAVAGTPLALGAVHPPVMAAAGVVSALALFLALLLRDGESPRLLGPAVVCWALAGWCLLQLVPLPMSTLESLAPANADIWQRALLPFGESGPAYASISLDPGATAIEAARWFSYGAIFVAAGQVASRHGARWVLLTIFSVALVVALVTLGHGLAGLTKVYGFYEPTFKPHAWHVGPLLNGNNLAGLLNLGAMCGLGFMLSERRGQSPWLIVTGVALMVAVGVISASRGGVALLFVGVVLLAITVELPNRRKIREASKNRARLMLGATLALGIALAVIGARAAIWNELLDENMEKLRMVSAVEPAFDDFSMFGMGRGSFESVFAAYQQDAGGVVFTHAENFVAQWVVEWGAPVSIAALLALGFFLRPARMGVRRSSLAAAAWIGVVILLVQNLVDLGLEIPGLCFPLAATIGALWGDPDLFPQPSRPDPSRRRSLVWGTAALVFGTALAIGSFVWGRHPVAADRLALREQLLAHQAPRPEADVEALRAGLRDAMLRHPAEPYFALLGAELAWEERTGRAIPWLQRALERSAVNGRAHLLLARVLWRHGARYQALLELRLAVEAEGSLVGYAARDAARWTQDLDEIARAAPKGNAAAQFWESAAHHLEDRALAAKADEKALELDPTRQEARWRLAHDFVELRKANKGCVGDEEAACAAKVEEHAAAIAEHAPTSSRGDRLRAHWLAATGEKAAAEKLLAERCETSSDAVVCLRDRAAIAASISGTEPFGEAAKALRRAACADRDACGEMNVWIGSHHMGRKEHALAVTAFEKAVREHATSARLQLLVDAAVAAGLSSRAARALERLIDRTVDPAERAALEKRRRDVLSRMFR